MEKYISQYLRDALYNTTKYVCHWVPAFAAYLAKKRTGANITTSHFLTPLKNSYPIEHWAGRLKTIY